MTTTPQAALSAPGLCHHLDVTGDPHAGPVTYRADGHSQVPLDLGVMLGRDVVLEITSEDYLIYLVDAALDAFSRLHIEHEDRPAGAA